MVRNQRKRKRRTNNAQSWQAYLFLLPAMLGLTFITIIPLLGVLGISFTNWNGMVAPKLVGFANYVKIFTKDLFFKQSIGVTLYYALGAVATSVIWSFLIAMLLNMNIRGRGIFRAIFYLPYIIPSIAVYIIWTWMYDPSFGVLNYFLRTIGLPASKWLYQPATTVPSLIIIAVWGAGNLIVIFLAGLQNVPKVYHEAAKIDGANSLHRFRHITIPMMTPIIFFNFLMCTVTQLQVFVPSYTITKGGPSNASMFLVYLIYREGFTHSNLGYASALSFIFFLMVVVITLLIFRFSKNMIFYEGK